MSYTVLPWVFPTFNRARVGNQLVTIWNCLGSDDSRVQVRMPAQVPKVIIIQAIITLSILVNLPVIKLFVWI